MSYSTAINTQTENNTEKLLTNRTVTDNNEDKGLTSLKTGQQITAEVISVDEQVTLDFGGQKITSPKAVLNNVRPGDIKTFEVVHASDREIELRVIDNNPSSREKTFTAVRANNIDYATLFSQKEQAASDSEREALYKADKQKLEEIVSKLTEQDLLLIEEEGFPVENFTIDGLCEALNRVKNKLAGIELDKTEKLTAYDNAVLAKRLRVNNLPETVQNIERLTKALELTHSALSINDTAMQYLISTNTEPTIENIYKACYSGSAVKQTENRVISEKVWNELLDQVKEVIRSAGYEINKESLSDARWLLDKQLPLTADTLTYKKNLEKLKTDLDKDTLLDNMIKGMRNGINPMEVPLIAQEVVSSEKIIADIHSISEECIVQAVKETPKLTIKKLLAVQERISQAGSFQTTDYKAADQRTADNISADAMKADIKVEDNKTVDTKAADIKATESKTADIKATENKTIDIKKDIKAEDNKTDDIKAADIKAEDNKIADLKAAENKTIDSKIADINVEDNKTVDSKAADIKATDNKIADLKAAENKTIDIKTVNIKAEDNKTFDSKATDVKAIDNKPLDTKEANSKASDGKADGIKVHGDKESEYDKADTVTTDTEAADTDATANTTEYEEIKAKRQLEELRLKMTLEAAGQLRKKGISIETEQLSKVVEELRRLEDNHYKDLLREANAEVSDSALKILKETTQSIEKIKYIPCSVLGATLSARNSQTITGLLAEGNKLQADYVKAGAAYETLATIPNSEYGDSIKKAFANSQYLLSQMNLDNTAENKRAIRILGYNQMEITEEAINQVKAYDEQVNAVIHNLHPAVTVRLIKEGVNPLDMPVNELNYTIEQMKEEQGITSEEKFSTYLRSLEKDNGISAEERKAYIGIYRLLYQVDKSDGAALGALIRTDREVTLGNLLSAVQTNKKGSINAVVDDEFGTLESISQNKETIKEQLSLFTVSDSNQVGQNSNDKGNSQLKEEVQVKERLQYLNRILKHVKDELSPEKLKAAVSNLSTTADADNMMKEEPSLSSDRGIWDKVKEVPIEKLLNQLRNMEIDKEIDKEAYAGKIQEIRELCKNTEQSIRFLNDFRIPSSPLNIMMANHILNNGESPIKKLNKQKNENIVENAENKLKESEDLSDTLIDKQTMLEKCEQLETEAKASLRTACMTGTIDSRRLAELNSTGQQLTFMKKLAEKEFYQIPIETNNKITNINLTILRGTEASGKVLVSLSSEKLGNIKAEFTLKEQALKGYITSDNRNGLESLQELTGDVEAAVEDYNVTVKQLDFGLQRKNSEAYSYQRLNREEQNAQVADDTEKILYRVAKATVQTIRRAESSKDNIEKAVS